MATFTKSDGLQGAEFVGADLTGARFVESDLSGVVMRGVEVAEADIDAPWLVHGGFLRVNGVDVIPFVEAELDRRFPVGPTDGPRIPTACARPGRRSIAPGQPRWCVSRRCPRRPWTSRWPASGRSRRRCATWSWPRTRGWGGASSRSSSRTTPSGCGTPPPRGTARTRRPRPRRPAPRRTPTCSTPVRTARRWCATTSPPSRPTSWPRRARTRMTPRRRRPSAPACT